MKGSSSSDPTLMYNGTEKRMSIQITSPAFAADHPIPQLYSGDGKDISPPLQWTGVPAGTRELAMIVDDPDAPRKEPWVHWVIYGIPADVGGLPEAVSPIEDISATIPGAAEGQNDFGNIGYGGPAPPRGHGVHHYHFRLYALSEPLAAAPGLDKRALLAAMIGKVIASGELVGTYERPAR